MNVPWAGVAVRARQRTPSFLLLWVLAAPWLFFPNRQPALTLLAALALLAGLLWLYRGGHLRPTPFDLLLFIYLGLSVVGLLVSPLPVASLRRVITLFVGVCGYYGLVSYLTEQGNGRAVAAAVRLLPVLGAGVAMAGLLTGRWPERFLLDLRFITGRLPHLGGSFTIHHNLLAGALALFLLPAIFSWRAMPGRAGRRLLAAAITLMALTLVLTQSRNGFLSLVVGLAGGLLWQRGRFRWLLALFLVLLVAPLVLGALPGIADEPLSGFLSRLDDGSKAGPAPEESWLARVEMWQAALHLMGDYPVIGAGLYQFEAVSRANEVYRTIRPDQALTHAHNLWLQVGAGMGWPGWLAAALLWLGALHALGQATEAAPARARWAGVALGAGLSGYLTFNSFDVYALEQVSGMLIWLLLALIAAFVRLYTPVPARKWELHLQVAPLLLLIGLLPWLPRNVGHLQLDRARLAGAGQIPPAAALAADDYRRLGLIYALQGQEEAALAAWRQDPEAVLFLQGQGLRAFIQEQETWEALEWYERSLALEPEAATVWYWQGVAYEKLGRPHTALASYRQACAYSLGVRLLGKSLTGMAWERQGRILVEQEAWQEARDAFAAAAAAVPDDLDYRQQLADVEQMLWEIRQEQMTTPSVAEEGD